MYQIRLTTVGLEGWKEMNSFLHCSTWANLLFTNSCKKLTSRTCYNFGFFIEFHGSSNLRKSHCYHAFIKTHWSLTYLNLPLFSLHKEPRMDENMCKAKEAFILWDTVPYVFISIQRWVFFFHQMNLLSLSPAIFLRFQNVHSWQCNSS